MKQADAESKGQRDALGDLGEFLQSGPAAFLRGMQALLVDPDEAGGSKRGLFGDLWATIASDWASAGTADADVMLLQAMLLASDWPATGPAHMLGPALLSPWMALRGREKQRAQLERWREARAREDMDGQPPSLSRPTKMHKSDAPALTALKNLSSGNFANDMSRWGLQPALSIAGFDALKNAVQAAIAETYGQMATLHVQTYENLETVRDIAIKSDENTHMLDFLWWGQARYCHTLRTPFRHISDRPKMIWLAALEAAEHAVQLPVEPSASYLQEVLHGLGLPLQEVRPLAIHFTELRDALNDLPRPSVPRELSTLLEQDAFGAPVILLCITPRISDDQLHSQFGVAPDSELELGDWIAWVFRELVFVRRWPEQS